jgi:metal-dependent amidase/aminoacylase/carboxypeptidase family protein
MNSLRRGLDGLSDRTEAFHSDLHAHLELSMQEHRTAERAATHISRQRDVT